MRIKELHAENIKGFETFKTECGDVNVCAGMNGTNKTSVLTLVTALFGNPGGKTDPLILRAGAEWGEFGATIESDDRSESWTISRQVTKGKIETPKITSSITGRISSPVEWLKPLIDKVSIDPITRAMHATPEEQTQILLSTIPMAVDLDELAKSVEGIEVPGLSAHLKNALRIPSGLDAISAIHGVIYDHRTNVNRDAKIKKTHADELLAGIPKSAGECDWTAKVVEIEAALQKLQGEEHADRVECETELGKVRTSLSGDEAKALRVIDEDIDTKIRILETERSRRQAAVKDDHHAKSQKLSGAHQENLDSVAHKYRSRIEKLATDLQSARNQLTDQVTHNRSREIAAIAAREAATLKAKSEDMTAALDRLDALKTSLLGKLDKEVKGLRLENGVPSLNGVPLSQLNTAEQGKFWIRIGAMRSGEMGICCADSMEMFDDQTFEKIIAGCRDSGLQFFLARVDNKPFRIEAR